MQMQADNKASLSPETESGGTFPSFPPFFPPPHSFWFCSNEKDIISFSPQSAASALSSSTTALGDRQTKGECIIVGEDQIGSAAAEAYQSSVMRTQEKHASDSTSTDPDRCEQARVLYFV